MHVLTLNVGSSSLKFDLWEVGRHSRKHAHQGIVRFGRDGSEIELDGEVWPRPEVLDPGIAVGDVLGLLDQRGLLDADCVAHRVVHGGISLHASAAIDDRVLLEIEAATALAPLHNKPALEAIKIARARFPRVPMVAVFDTSFHAQMPAKASTYAIDADLAAKYGIKRYGFHGLAHAYMVERWSELTSVPIAGSKLVTLQLGSGSSAAAILDGRSIDTTMGFTPLAGLVMETRSGDIDPGIISFLCEREGVLPGVVEDWLNHESGLKGVARVRDMRELIKRSAAGDARAYLAIDMFVYQIQKYVGAYLAALGGADAVVFGGGIGEHAPEIRTRVIEGFRWLGVRLDAQANSAAIGVDQRIAEAGSKIDVWTVAVDESAILAREAAAVIETRSGQEHLQ